MADAGSQVVDKSLSVCEQELCVDGPTFPTSQQTHERNLPQCPAQQ